MSARLRFVRHDYTDRARGLEFIAELEDVCPYHWVPLTGRKRKWCRNTCYYLFQVDQGIILDWHWVRWMVLERDDWTCKACGLKGHGHSDMDETGRTILEVDHTVEIQDGGPEFDLSNLRTLCHWCHASKTAARRAGRDPERALWERTHLTARPLEAFA